MHESFDVFVIMPYKPAFTAVYEAICTSVRGAGRTKIGRLDSVVEAGDLVSRLKEAIKRSRMCIADITSNNPNVLWEAGFAMALDKPVLFLTQNPPEDNPFDVRGHQTIQYDPKNLTTTFLTDVAQAVAHTLDKLPQWSDVNADHRYSNAFSLASASPGYFLDMQFMRSTNRDDCRLSYVMKDMNLAAVLIFDIEKKDVLGKDLGVFLECLGARLDNRDEVARNYKEQTKHIIDKCFEGAHSDIRPYHFEQIILKTQRFGRLDLFKTAVAVREANVDVRNGRNCPIAGWTVTFSIKKGDFTKINSYYSAHEGGIIGYWY